jgi:MFS family permease
MTTVDTDVRARLSWVWVFVMLNMIFADIFSFMNAGTLQQIMEGRADQIAITPEFLLLAAVLTEIPIAMVVLSQVLPRRANRRANLAAGIFTIAYVVGMGSATPSYIFLAGLEVLGCLCISWLAWTWHGSDERVTARDRETGPVAPGPSLVGDEA